MASAYGYMAGVGAARHFMYETQAASEEPSYALTKKGLKNLNAPTLPGSLKAGALPRSKSHAAVMAFVVLASGQNSYRVSLRRRKREAEKKAKAAAKKAAIEN